MCLLYLLYIGRDDIESDMEVKIEDEESRPLTQKELKERIMKVVSGQH